MGIFLTPKVQSNIICCCSSIDLFATVFSLSFIVARSEFNLPIQTIIDTSFLHVLDCETETRLAT